MTRKPTIAQVVQVLKDAKRRAEVINQDCDGEVSCPRGRFQIACLKRAIEIVKAKGGK